MHIFKPKHTSRARNEQGFTLLFAVLVSTLVVAIGATIVSIAVRQTILSGTARESQFAFYAANTVLECAFYWDVAGLPFDSGIQGTIFATPNEQTSLPQDFANIVTCAGESLDVDIVGNTSSFEITIQDAVDIKEGGVGIFSHEYCARAEVTKTEANDIVTTRIEAKGYNAPCDALDGPRTVERGLIQSYQS